MPKKPRYIKVKYRRLENVWGFAHIDARFIELDFRLKGKKHCEILLHELIHLMQPDASEEEVERQSILMCNTLWKEGYRRIDQDTNDELQDGTR